MTIAALIALAILAQAPAKPLDEAAFLREASRGWAVLEKAYADIQWKHHSESMPGGTRDEESFARLGKRVRAERGERFFPGRPPKFPGFRRAYVTDGTASFVADKMASDSPFLLREYHADRTAEDDRALRPYEAVTRLACFANALRPWSEQVKRPGFSIILLEGIKEGSRDLIRMHYREDSQPDEVASIIKGWCMFDPKENYLPVESEVEIIQNATKRFGKLHIKVEHKSSDRFSGLRLVPARMTRTTIAINTFDETYEFEEFAPCKLKEADFRPEAFGLETPR